MTVLRLIWKDLLHEPVRFAVTLAGVAGALTLVLALGGLFEGTSDKIVIYPAKSGADLWVMQQGVSNMHMASSVLPDGYLQRIAADEAVEHVTPVLYVNGVVTSNNRRWFSYVIGIREAEPLGGPWDVPEGRPTPAAGGVVIPNVFARQAGLSLGDEVSILGQGFRIDGISNGTYSMANSLTFVRLDDLVELLSAGPVVSYFLAEAAPGVPTSELAGRIESQVPGTNVMLTADFIASDRVMAQQMGTDIIQVMTLIGFIIGVAVIGITMYGAIVGSAREYGVAKAIGMTNLRLAGLVVAQSGVIVLAGFALALGLAALLKGLLPVIAPDLAVAYTGELIIRVAVAAVAMGIAASILPAWRIARLEPVIVFKE